MATYETETHYYEDGSFSTDGRIVSVLSHSPISQRVTVLVEKQATQHFETLPLDSEGLSLDEIQAEIEVGGLPGEKDANEEDPTCAGKNGDCSRSVSQPGDVCWQHEEE